MPNGSRCKHAEYRKFSKLSKCKNYAIGIVYDKYYFLPIERQDLEMLAWEAFVEVEKNYDESKHKSYESYFIDLVRWKCKDYCAKFLNNKHLVLNTAITYDLYSDEITTSEGHSETERLIGIRSVIDRYLESNVNNQKGEIVQMLSNNVLIKDICTEMDIPRTTLYKLLKEIEQELRVLLK